MSFKRPRNKELHDRASAAMGPSPSEVIAEALRVRQWVPLGVDAYRAKMIVEALAKRGFSIVRSDDLLTPDEARHAIDTYKPGLCGTCERILSKLRRRAEGGR